MDCMVAAEALHRHCFQLSPVSDMQCEVVCCHDEGWQYFSLNAFPRVHISFFWAAKHSKPCPQSHRCLLCGMSYVKLHWHYPKHDPSVLFVEHINFLLVAFSYGPSQLTISCLISGVHAGIFVYTVKSLVDVCSWVVLRKEFSHWMLAEQDVFVSHFVTLNYRNSRGAHALDLFSYWRR